MLAEESGQNQIQIDVHCHFHLSTSRRLFAIAFHIVDRFYPLTYMVLYTPFLPADISPLPVHCKAGKVY
jgi:hypothetical protein